MPRRAGLPALSDKEQTYDQNRIDPLPARASWSSRARRWLLAGTWGVCRLVLVSWASLALYYSTALGLGAAGAGGGFATFSVWALWLTPNRAGCGGGAVPPRAAVVSLDPPVVRSAVAARGGGLPRAIIDGERVRFTGFRNFDYRSTDDFTVRWEEREVSLAHLTSVDLFISYWSVGPVGHTFVSFSFDNAPPVCISIETKPELGEGFAPVASLFKQFELIYVVGDERDLVRVRTNHRNEEVFLYRIKTPPEAARRLFLVYLERINELAERPEFYHLLKNSCTINIVRYANAAGREGALGLPASPQRLGRSLPLPRRLGGHSLPFDELRQRSRINDAVRAAGNAPDFSPRIRAAAAGGAPRT